MAQASIDLIAAAVRILSEIQPASVRAVCYRLFTEERIPDMKKASTDKVSRLLVHARESGQLPWDWIVDETRQPERVASWDSPEQIIASAVRQYRKNYWSAQDNRVEVWSEKGTLRGTLAPVLDEYGVTFRVMGGYGSATMIHTAAIDSAESDKPLTVLYCGDWDPSGLHMSEVDLQDRIARYGGEMTFKRVALDANDTAPGTKLPSFPVESKAGDSRYAWFRAKYGMRCWEVDALPPPILRSRVDDEIVDLLDLDLWNHTIDVEKVERESMQDFMQTWKRTISGQASKYSGGRDL